VTEIISGTMLPLMPTDPETVPVPESVVVLSAHTDKVHMIAIAETKAMAITRLRKGFLFIGFYLLKNIYYQPEFRLIAINLQQMSHLYMTLL
jgi:hypothetical protein